MSKEALVSEVGPHPGDELLCAPDGRRGVVIGQLDPRPMICILTPSERIVEPPREVPGEGFDWTKYRFEVDLG